MSDDPLIDSEEQDKRAKFSKIIAGVLAAVGLFLFLTYRSYLDVGHIPLSIIYFALCFSVLQTLSRAKISVSVILIVVAAGVLIFSIAKIRWNESYLQGLATPQAFIFEDYIDHYPILEEHIFAVTLGKKDWVRLAERCVLPLTRGRPVEGFCRQPQLIQKAYRINVEAEINEFMKRMQKTAMDVKEGRIKTGAQYQKCIAEKRCAPIPLLPENVDAKKLEGDNTQYVEVRQAFWDLVERRGLTKPVCEAMVLCRATLATGALSFSGATPSDNPAQ